MAKNKEFKKKHKLGALTLLASIIIGLAIVIFWPIFVHNGIKTFVEEPKLETYCANISYEIATTSCENVTIGDSKEHYSGPYPINNCWCDQICNEKGCTYTNKCHVTNPEYVACNEEWNKDSEQFRKSYFIIAIIVGLIGLVIGLYLKNGPVAIGLMAGSVIVMIMGTVQYWGQMSDRTKFIFSGIVLLVLIFIAYKKFSKR